MPSSKKEKGPDDETTTFQSSEKTDFFQRTVSDVMALPRVFDVMTLVT